MYEWAVGDGDEYGENGCAVLFDCLPEEPGHFVMCYYSYRQDAIIASSEPFEVSGLLALWIIFTEPCIVFSTIITVIAVRFGYSPRGFSVTS